MVRVRGTNRSGVTAAWSADLAVVQQLVNNLVVEPFDHTQLSSQG